MTWSTANARSQPDGYLGLPGDNLNLYAVMKLFQESKTLEGFERSLNDENSRINNLDLNGDNLIDYITVTDHPDGDVHNIVLQDALNQFETQDVAVFTVQKFPNGSVRIQLTGDEALYGKNYIIEPNYADNAGETPNPGYTGGEGYSNDLSTVRYTTYEIADWPLVHFIFLPGYMAWHSSWYWGYWPTYWHPWQPSYWDYYYGYQHSWFPDYYRNYRLCDHSRYIRYNNFYYNTVRSYAPQVHRRIGRGEYRATYSHPEQRHQGEALYSKMHGGQNHERGANASVNNHVNRNYSRPAKERNSSGTSYNSNHRTTNNFSERRVSNRYLGSKSGDSRRLSASTAPRTAPETRSVRSAGPSRRSSGTFAGRTSSRPEKAYRGSSPRSSDRSMARVGSSGQRNSGGSRTGTSVTRSSNARETGNRKSDHRR